MKPRLLDLFCGAGGAARGYQLAGFHVTGVDIAEQPDYCGDRFVKADIEAWLSTDLASVAGLWLSDFDAIHASPPCQAFTAMSNRWRGKGGLADRRRNLIPLVRDALVATGRPYVIENVVDARAELVAPAMLCGRSLGLEIHRHRLFETSWPLMVAPCSGHRRDRFGIYGDCDGRLLWRRKDGSEYRAWRTLKEGQDAMEMPWVTTHHGIREAIPPAYTELLGSQLIGQLDRVAA